MRSTSPWKCRGRHVRSVLIGIALIVQFPAAAETPVVVWSEPTHAGVALSISFSPDGLLLASGGDGGVVIRSSLDGSFVRQMSLPGDNFAVAVTFSPNGQFVAAGGRAGQVCVWSVAGGEPVLERFGESDCTGLAFSPDGALISAGFRDSRQRVWSFPDGELVHEFDAGVGEINCTAFSPISAPRMLVVSGHHAQKWGVTPLVDLGSIDLNSWIRSVTFSADGQRLAAGSTDTNVRLWNVADGALVQTFIGHTMHVEHVAFSPDGELIASSGSGVGRLRLWDASGGPGSLVAYDGEMVPTDIYGVEFSPNRREFAYCRLDGVVVMARLADCASGDVTGDHLIDLADLAALLANFGTRDTADFADGDLNGNGDVDLGDLSRLLATFGQVCMN